MLPASAFQDVPNGPWSDPEVSGQGRCRSSVGLTPCADLKDLRLCQFRSPVRLPFWYSLSLLPTSKTSRLRIGDNSFGHGRCYGLVDNDMPPESSRKSGSDGSLGDSVMQRDLMSVASVRIEAKYVRYIGVAKFCSPVTDTVCVARLGLGVGIVLYHRPGDEVARSATPREVACVANNHRKRVNSIGQKVCDSGCADADFPYGEFTVPISICSSRPRPALSGWPKALIGAHQRMEPRPDSDRQFWKWLTISFRHRISFTDLVLAALRGVTHAGPSFILTQEAA